MEATRRSLLLGGAALGLGTLVDAPAAASSRSIPLRVAHASMQFSDDYAQHHHDARAVFRHARETGHVIVTGTESGRGNSLYGLILRAAQAHGYAIHRSPSGEWVAVDRRFGRIVDRGEIPVIPALSIPAGHGGHGARGIVWTRIHPHDRRIGTIVYGAGHWLTHRSLRARPRPGNDAMTHALGRWARRAGDGTALVFYGADTNRHDEDRDVFGGAPLRSCWDEIHRHPPTRIHGTIDVIASYDRDDRVSCRDARVLGDRRLFLFSDHSLIEATYAIRSL
jgi:hypothetical protein